MSAPASSLYRRLVLLLGGVALLIVVVALVILRRTAGDAAINQVARSLHTQIVLAETVLDDSAVSPVEAGPLLRSLDLHFEAVAPRERLVHARFWDGVSNELESSLPGHEVRFENAAKPIMWIRRAAPDRGWIGIPVAPLRNEVARSVVATIIASSLIVLVAAALYARTLTLPLRRLAEAAPEIAAGRTVDPLASGAAREFRELESALNDAAASVRETAADRSLMLAALSHDMRTPLARLRLACELAGVDEPMREGMHADIDELDRLIGQCIDYARDGRDEPVERLDAIELIRDLVATQERLGPSWQIEAPAQAMIECRPLALRRALANLMENARLHGREPFSVACEVSRDRLVVRVLDRGEGVDPTLIGRLGTPFLQASPSREPGRSGLGLASAVRVARQHGGDVVFAGRDGGGFEAALTIPLIARSDS